MIANVAWLRSGRDNQVHAFVLTQVAEPGRAYLEALCKHSAPPAAPVFRTPPAAPGCASRRLTVLKRCLSIR